MTDEIDVRNSGPTVTSRRVLVTGAGTGIGAAVAKRLAEDGCSVVLHANRSIAQAEEMAEVITQSGGSATVIGGDLALDRDVSALVAQAGAVDILINNAARSQIRDFEQISPSDFEEVMRVNLWAPFRLVQLVLPHMKSQSWGRIVNIASIGGQWGGTRQIHYACAKAGLIGLTRSIAKTYAPLGITANAVSPGLIETDMIRALLKSDSAKSMLETIPVQRVGETIEVAEAVAFLVSESSGYITGQTLNVNGGMLFT